LTALPVLLNLPTAASLRQLDLDVSVAATAIAAPASFLREPSAVRVVPAASHCLRCLAGCAAS
jgi:hypothetical protein